MNLFGIIKFLLGFFLAIALMVGGSVAAAFYFMNRGISPPPKPIFANEKPDAKPKRPTSTAIAKDTPIFAIQPSPTPSPSETASKPLEPGAYRARVTWPQGLILRAEPNLDAERIGGLGYNQQIVVLAESGDKSWQQIRSEGGDQQGWVKAGNIERVQEQGEQVSR